MTRLREFAPGLHLAESTIRFYGVRLQTRMSVVRLADTRLFVHSPVALDAALRGELDRLGEVGFIASPNKIHHLAMGDYVAAYPEARALASPGLPERRPDLEFDGVLGDHPEPDWAGDLDQAEVRGNVFFSEIVFLHRASRTLLVADLVENLDRETASPFGRALARLFGVGSKPVASPEHRLYTDDAAAAAASLQRIRSWEFERIVLSHGGLIESGGPEVLEAVCADLLRRVRNRSSASRRILAAMARFQ
jgi:hypothetical protein